MENRSVLASLSFLLRQIPAVVLLLISGWFNAAAVRYIWTLSPTDTVLVYGLSGVLTVALLGLQFWPRYFVRHLARWITLALQIPLLLSVLGWALIFVLWIPPLALFGGLILAVLSGLCWAVLVVDAADSDRRPGPRYRLRPVEWIWDDGIARMAPADPLTGWETDSSPLPAEPPRPPNWPHQPGHWQFAPRCNLSVPSIHTAGERNADNEDWQGDDGCGWDEAGW